MRKTSHPVFQAYRHDGLRVRQQREGLRIVHAGTNEELDVITESMDLLTCQPSALETYCLRIEEGGGDCSECVIRGGFTVTDALSAKARKPSPGLEGV